MKITSTLVHDELRARGVPVEIVDECYELIRFRRDDTWHYSRISMPDSTSAVGRFVANQKPLAMRLAAEAGLPVPAWRSATDNPAAFLAEHGRVVVKPCDGTGGAGVTVDITDPAQLPPAIDRAIAAALSRRALVQRHVTGADLRVLTIGDRFVAAVERRPATVTGDGTHSIRTLIDHENADPDRTALWPISVPAAESYLGLLIDTIPSHGTEVRVVGPSNASIGGSCVDVTDRIPPSIADACVRLAGELGLSVCGTDLIRDRDTHWFLEVNGAPSLAIHACGDVIATYVDFLLGQGKYAA